MLPRTSTSRPSWVASPRPSGPTVAVPADTRWSSKRVTSSAYVAERPGAVDHRGEPHRAPRAEPHHEGVGCVLDVDHLVGTDGEPAIHSQLVQRRGRRRCHPVPVQVPPRRVLAEEGRPVVVVELRPEGTCQRPERVEGGPPVPLVAHRGQYGLGDELTQAVEADRQPAGRCGEPSRRRGRRLRTRRTCGPPAAVPGG